jgi:hypothetical protein
MPRHAIVFIAAIAVAAPLLAQDALPRAELPVTKVVLFASGVGYFEHEGTVTDSTRLSLSFKTEQINDVLKSLVFMDAGGGTVSSVNYASNDPIERALHSFGIDLSGAPGLPQILSQLRGATVTVRAPEPTTGSILSVQEKTTVHGQPPATTTEHILTLVTAAGIRTLPLSSIDSIEFTDGRLRDELGKALQLLVESRDSERKQVDLNFVGQGERQVRVGYLVETPVWKTTYRLDLSPILEQEQPLLQGWAIVENTSDNDWQRVVLSLVSGRPISFTMDLYTPLYVQRPAVQPKLMASLQPRTHDDGIEATRDRVAHAQTPAPKAMMQIAPAAPAPAAAEARVLARAGGADDVRLDELQAAALAGSVGELFQFTLKQPVDMPRQRSAMIHIINQKVDAQKVSIYNPSAHVTHPLNGVILKNDTGLKMLAGPVTVFDGGAYAGDAQIDHLSPGDKRLLSYAVDLAVTVDPSQKTSARLVAARIVQGVLQVSHVHTHAQEYVVKNEADAKRTLIIEHPFHAARKLVQPTEYYEKTPALYRFRVLVDADKTGTFAVIEEQTIAQGIALLNTDVNSLVYYQGRGEIPQAVRAALARVISAKQELTALEQQLRRQQGELATIKQGQDRLRQNIAAVGADSLLGKRYLAKLSAEEDQIEKLDREALDLQTRIDTKRRELVEMLKGLDVS